jgi:N-methylhydantoinase B
VEALEYAYPFRVRRYAYRQGSGGKGQFRGGDGLVREIELLAPAQVTLLADRRSSGPWGLQGGENGAPGRATVFEGESGQGRELPGKCSLHLAAGDVLRLETPGGGGWGRARSRKSSRSARIVSS